MPTRKQRRRRLKSRRHDYEYVYVDEQGREVAVGEDAEPPAKAAKNETRARRPGGRAARTVQPPPLRRALRRALIFGPLMFLVIWIAQPNTPPAARVAVALFYTLLFIPFIYLADTLAYRVFNRRERRETATKRG